MREWMHLTAISISLVASATATAETTSDAGALNAAKAEAVTRAFIAKLSDGKATEAVAAFDEPMRRALPPDKLAGLWRSLEKDLGPFQSLDKVDQKLVEELWTCFATIRFAHGRTMFRIIVNQRGQIDGFWNYPTEPLTAWEPPSYVSPESFSDRPIIVGNNPGMRGHLIVPKGKGPVPVAILVHGSGPGDEDETIGPNKPFKDLALGLGSKGIAVLRFDKRTHVPPPPSPVTVQTEYFPTFADAMALARRTNEVDPHRIVLVGHSLGAQVAPWLAKDNSGLAGIVLLAPPVRSALAAAIAQLEDAARIYSDNKEVSSWLADQISELKRGKKRVDDGTLGADEVVFHAPGTYWASLRGYDPVATAAALTLPILIAQGERDANVSPTFDYPRWKDGLAKKTNVTFKLYPNLNHLFVTWGGKATVEDNMHAGHVDQKLVDDLAAWIQALPAAK
jgi:pimeloyl-ACP methyl ester carboxylesterase